MGEWYFEITELDKTPIAEVVNAHERKVSMNLSRPSTASIKLAANSPLIPTLFERDVLLRAWQGSSLRFWGPVQNVQAANTGDNAETTVAVTAADPSVRFPKRIIYSGGTNFLSGDKVTIIESALNDVNNDTGFGGYEVKSHTGVRTAGKTCGTTTTYYYQHFTNLGTLITDLGASAAGFDWHIEPEVSGTAGVLGYFNAAALLGSDKPDAVFEFGLGRRNIRTFNFTRDLSDIVNRAVYVPEDEWAPTSWNDEKSAKGRGRYEDVVDTIGLADESLREAWCKDVVEVKKDPRRVLEFTPDFESGGRVPVFGTDYYLGDTVRAAVAINGTTVVDGKVRIYKVEANIDDNGQATMTPTTIDEGVEFE